MDTDARRAPYYIDWAITFHCNLRCAHCRGNPQTEIPTDRAMSLLGEMRELQPGWLLIEGGEPLMRDDIFPLLHYASEIGHRISLISNGMLLTPEAVGWLANEKIRVMVSIDSPDPNVFETLRVGASLARVRQAASDCAAAGILEAINVALSRVNLRHIPDLFRLARDIGSKQLNIIGLKPCESYAAHLLTPREYRRAIEMSCRASLETGVQFFFDEPFFKTAAREWKCAYLRRDEPGSITIEREPGCILGKYIFIGADGDVRPCSFAPLSMGNVMGESLPSIWERMGRSELLLDMMDRSSRKGACGVCAHRDECGGCRARAHNLTGDWCGPDTACPLSPSRRGGR